MECKICKKKISNSKFTQCNGLVKDKYRGHIIERKCGEFFHEKCFKKHWKDKHMRRKVIKK